MLSVGIRQQNWPFPSSPAVSLGADGLKTKCWFCVGYNAFMDFSLALLPITIVYGLNLALKRKIALATLLSLGILYETTSLDFSWTLVDTVIAPVSVLLSRPQNSPSLLLDLIWPVSLKKLTPIPKLVLTSQGRRTISSFGHRESKAPLDTLLADLTARYYALAQKTSFSLSAAPFQLWNRSMMTPISLSYTFLRKRLALGLHPTPTAPIARKSARAGCIHIHIPQLELTARNIH